MKDTFCPIPWLFQAVRANGDIRICCQANVTKNKGVIRKSDGSAYNAGIDNIEDARNAELMNEVRKNMLNGVWSEECGRCKREEENGLVSRREFENEAWDFNIEAAKQVTHANGTIDMPVRYYDLRFGNFCNLKCRMCGPTDSNAWYEDWIKLTGSNTFQESSKQVEIYQQGNKLHVDGYEWPEYEPFWQQLENNISNIEHVYFAGGEPMLIERHYDFLEKCIEQDAAKNIQIEYNTNMTTLPSRVLELWTHFKKVMIGASVDGMGAVLEYQRHPVKWNKVYKNLQKVDSLPDNIQSWLTFTVTAYNVNHMIDFMKWKLQDSNFKRVNSTKKRPIISPHVAHHPMNLNVRVLPDELKAELTDKFENFVQWCKDEDYPHWVVAQAEKISTSVTSFMNSESYYDEHWEGFVSYTKSLDRMRNENLLDVEPMFKDYI